MWGLCGDCVKKNAYFYVFSNQQFLLMASVNFFVKNKKNAAPIYLRLRNGRSVDITLSTGLLIDHKFWSDARGEVKQTSSFPDKINLNNELHKIKTVILESINAATVSGTTLNKQWLIDVLENHRNPSQEEDKTIYFVDLLKKYKEHMQIKINPKSKKPIAATTLRNYDTTIRRFKLFQEYKKRQYTLDEINLEFHNEFIQFLKFNQNLAQNSISKDVKQIKTVCIDARDNGLKVSDQVISRKFNAPLEETTFVTITEPEIEAIKNFKGTDYLMNARDWLIIGCWTGCRVNDLMQLSEMNIKTHVSGKKFIRYTQSKTNKQVDIPIHPHVEEILDRLGGFPRPISDQRFNEWIKVVCKESGLTKEVVGTRQNPKTHKKEVGTFQKWELVRSHTCRRSFATNHYNKLPNKLIMAVTGHSTEKMLLNYIGETENDHMDDFLNVWTK